MPKELDTSWFDLKKYDKLNELDLCQWARLLSLRGCLYEGMLTDRLPDIKENPISADFDLLELDEKSTVYSVDPFRIPLYLNNSMQELVMVNLLATDEQVMRDFQYWLTEYRKAKRHKYEARKKNFTNKDVSEWIEYRVLPYMDLMIVAKLEGKTITNFKAGTLLFPDNVDIDVDPTERVRRTIKPKARLLLKYSALTAIRSQSYSA